MNMERVLEVLESYAGIYNHPLGTPILSEIRNDFLKAIEAVKGLQK